MAFNKKDAVKALVTIALVITTIHYALALPSQPNINYISNSTSAASGIGAARDNDPGGYIITLNLNATQQNYKWKAYVGNVTGQLVLEDQDQYSIYQWDMQLNAFGNVYISRNGSVTWAGINCSNRSVIETEDAFLNINGTSSSINSTFFNTTHKTFKVSGVNYANSTCPAIATYVNDTAQTVNETAKFQEILLADSASNLVYMTVLEQNVGGFDNGVYDFQAIVAEDEALGTPTRYYFYVELEG